VIRMNTMVYADSIPVRVLFYYVDGETIANQVIEFIRDNQ